jgi:hypothetical protein
MGVYLDDCVSGQVIRDNIFERMQRAVMIGGGCDILVEGNRFIDCHPAIWLDARGLDTSPVWVNMVHTIMRQRYEAMQPRQSPYREKYPELLALGLEEYFEKKQGIPPLNDLVRRNVCVGGEWLDSSWHPQAVEYVRFEENELL